MEPVEAWSVLGLRPGADWDQIRSSYRRLIRASHPDLVGSGGAGRAAQLNDAYTTLARARRQGRLSPAAPPPPPTSPRRPPSRPGRPADRPTGPVEVLEGDTVFLPVPVDEAFVLVANACHRIGEVTYVDRSAPILETVLPLEGVGACSLVITFQGRAHGTEAFCTLEALQRVAQPPVHHVVAALVDALQTT
jgi:hypothetical protein